jgi:hypothetical protein
MWRWVTRGLVLTLMAALFVPALTAQQFSFVGDLELPSADPAIQHSGMILVRGWALDPGIISKIELYVDDQFQHTLNIRLPRIDLAEAFPDYPGIHEAQPGFQTGFSANRFTSGPHTVEIRVYTSDGQVHFLGRRTININNGINQAPFGSVDIPDLNGIHNATGSFPVNGWAADTDGILRVEVQIDGANMQGAMYGDPRPDVANAYPDFPAAGLSGFVANVDTTRIANGVHLLTVIATDRRGMSRMIGRRQIQVFNNDTFLNPFGVLEEPLRDATLYGDCTGTPPIISPFIRNDAHITPVRGWALDLGTRQDQGRVAYIELLVDGVPWLTTDDCGIMFGQYANCYGLPRHDVHRFYPSYPDAPRAGFFFTLDVGALLLSGVREGFHRMSVRVSDRDQTFTELPNRDGIPVFLQCDAPGRDHPSFGYIDYPEFQDYVGGMVTFRGWALDENGVNTVEILIDGNFVGNAQYGLIRTDVANVHPQFVSQSRTAGWAFTMDTSRLTDARHRVTVRVTDQLGRAVEIGSKDFYTENNPSQ